MRTAKLALMIVLLTSTHSYAFHSSYAMNPGQAGQIFASEPARIGFGEVVLVDDKSCPVGQIKEITGGNRNKGIPRAKRCISH